MTGTTNPTKSRKAESTSVSIPLVDSAFLLFVEFVVPVIWARNLLEAVSPFARVSSRAAISMALWSFAIGSISSSFLLHPHCHEASLCCTVKVATRESDHWEYDVYCDFHDVSRTFITGLGRRPLTVAGVPA